MRPPTDGEGSYGDHVSRRADALRSLTRQTWQFQHPLFRADSKHNLDAIKRKAPAPRKQAAAAAPAPAPAAPSAGPPARDPQHEAIVANLHAQVQGLGQAHGGLASHVMALTKDYQSVVAELQSCQQTVTAQDRLLSSMIQYLVNLEHSNAIKERRATADGRDINTGEPFAVSSEVRQLVATYNEQARPSAPRDAYPRPSGSGAEPVESSSRRPHTPAASDQPTFDGASGAGPSRGHNAGYVAPHGVKLEPNTEPTFYPAPEHGDAHALRSGPSSNGPLRSPLPTSDERSTVTATLNPAKRRLSSAPSWAVAPRVLLVEDDDVCRRLSSKFLQLFGCTIDEAVDGMAAVDRINAGERFDLIFMDLMMPRLDGATATTLIRQVAPNIPIVSMTSLPAHDNPASGLMSDHLAKPFRKEDLLAMLQKHLAHLKALLPGQLPTTPGYDDPPLPALESGMFADFGLSDADIGNLFDGLFDGSTANEPYKRARLQ